MKIVIAATLAVTAGLVLANMLGVAAAEAPTGTTVTTGTSPASATPVRTVGVEGVANVPIAQGADLEVATSAYRQGMAAAVADGQSKAEFLASKAGATLGIVQSITEDGGSIGCTGGEEEADYVGYQGEQPDFGSAASVAPVQAAAAAPRVAKSRSRHSKRKASKPTAKKADATICTLTAQVSLVYAIS